MRIKELLDPKKLSQELGGFIQTTLYVQKQELQDAMAKGRPWNLKLQELRYSELAPKSKTKAGIPEYEAARRVYNAIFPESAIE